jgi:hypothetical protein
MDNVARAHRAEQGVGSQGDGRAAVADAWDANDSDPLRHFRGWQPALSDAHHVSIKGEDAHLMTGLDLRPSEIVDVAFGAAEQGREPAGDVQNPQGRLRSGHSTAGYRVLLVSTAG